MADFRSGFVALTGKPNVGKSSLINRIMGQKIVITSDKPQTTRNRINCVYTTDDSQTIFVDTPGIHQPVHKLGEYMVKIAVESLKGVELLLFVIDPFDGIRERDMRVAQIVNDSKVPAILVLNKVDKGFNELKFKQAEEKIRTVCDKFVSVVKVSAIDGTGLEELKQSIYNNLPNGPKYYPEDIIADKPSRFLISELIREKIFNLTMEEIPHSTGVVVEDLKVRDNGTLYVRADIYCERDSQKGIIIGKKGQMIKNIGLEARKDVQNLFERKVFLDLFVKVKKKWRESDFIIKNTMSFKDEL